MKRMMFLLVSAFALITSSLHGNNGLCCWDGLCGQVYVYGDWLYWKARRSGIADKSTLNLDLTVDSFILPATTVIDLDVSNSFDLDYESGYRIGGGYLSDSCWGVEVRYTDYCINETSDLSVDAAITAGTVTRDSGQQLGSSTYKLDYQVLDVLLGYYVHNCCWGTLNPYVGARFAWIDEDVTWSNINVVTTTSTSLVALSSGTNKRDLYGLVLGFDWSKIFFCDRVGFFTHFLTSALVSDEKANLNLTSLNVVDAITGDATASYSEHRLVAAMELAVGLEALLFDLCGVCVSGKIGYEFHKWWNLGDFLTLGDSLGLGLFNRGTACLGLDGLFIRVQLTY